ncbi:RNA polymerase II transcriptional coactivator [Sitodiplosis mosellana]|uniref:RNA polymerase II transcriptional coactivator n=1 Tax=Sitodiplosis mosellana TaxID=263140 RepID=UPI002443F1B0|nr:RNA polymerase II transcriptional coactivator [Sitodiplosis mosellana]
MPKKKAAPESSSSDSDSGPDDRTPVKKPKKDSDGNLQFELSNNRRVTVSSFKGKVYVNIREFYQKDGDWLPGKKGIALSPEQWNALLEKSDEINKAIKET